MDELKLDAYKEKTKKLNNKVKRLERDLKASRGKNKRLEKKVKKENKKRKKLKTMLFFNQHDI